MLREAFYRRMIDLYNFLAQVESIHGDVDLFVRLVEKSINYSEKLKKIAKSEYDKKMAEANTRMNRIIMSVLRREIEIEEFKEK